MASDQSLAEEGELEMGMEEGEFEQEEGEASQEEIESQYEGVNFDERKQEDQS